jgi:F-type H+-transporting ATPase subunit alpha
MVAVLNQPRYQPWPMEEQVAVLFAGVNGYLDDIPTDQVPRFIEEFRQKLRADSTVLKAIRETGDLSDETSEDLRKEIDGFKGIFNVGSEAA